MAAPSSCAGLGRVLMTTVAVMVKSPPNRICWGVFQPVSACAGGQRHPQPVGLALEACFLAVSFGVESGLIESR